MTANILLAILVLLSVSLVFCFYMLIRNSLTLKYSVYWVNKVDKHQIDCIYTLDTPSADYTDIVEYDKYLWKILTFDRDKMIRSDEALKTLKKYK